MADEAILDLLRQHLAGADSVYFAPSIPDHEEHAVRRAHAGQLAVSERILVLYDRFSARPIDGFAITAQRLCWKSAAGRSHQIEWAHLDPDALYTDGRRLVIGDSAVEISGDASLLEACADAFSVLALSARRARPRPLASTAPTSPPPPHAISYHAYAVHASSQKPPAYACWQCATPLYLNMPQCARSGASPSAQGWLRTG